MRKKELAAAILGRQVPRLFSIKGGTRALPILAYHRVLDDDPNTFPFDEQVISANSESFRKQMEFIRDNFETVSFDDLYRHELEKRPWPKHAVLITFDDGYRDNYTVAFPVLRQLGLRATVFLASGHIGSDRLFWWDAISYLVKQTRLNSISLPEEDTIITLNGQLSRRVAIDRILGWIKHVPEHTKNRFLANLPSLLEAEIPPAAGCGMHLTWDEVREMSSSGIEFGSHTVTHPVLANVGDQQLEFELSSSKEKIESELGKRVVAFAYPVGGQSFNEATEKAVSRAGYRYAVSYIDGLAKAVQENRYKLPRIHVESGQSLNLFRASLSFPSIMYR